MNKILITVFVLTALVGCNVIEERIIYESAEPAPSPASPRTAQPNAEIIERRFATPENQADAVQSAVAWAKKYEEATQKNMELQERHNAMFMENTEIKRQLEIAKMDLERTQQELKEANAFLQEMHVELNKWKADVLGFREEMRQAQKAQLEALSRVLQILGAEPAR